MNKDISKSSVMNLVVLTLGVFPCFYPAAVFWGLSTLRAWIPLGMLILTTILVYVVTFAPFMSLEVKKKVMILLHVIYTFGVVYCVGNNNLMFSVLSISQIIILLAFDRKLSVFQLVVFEVFCVVMRIWGPLVIEESYFISDYIFCMVALAIQTFVFHYIIRTNEEHARAEKELIHTSSDLLKVVERKCEDARVATKSKSEFLANMSHEIRTPINAVLGLNEMVLRESGEQNILGYAHDIKSSGTTLLNLINDVLDFSKIESGKMEIIPVSYDISSVLNDLVNMINIKANDKGLSFKLTVDSCIPRILVGDEVRVKQIITNILTNAVKYTQEGFVKLDVGFEKVDDFAINLNVSVKDSGIGMKPEDMAKLFSPFERIEESRNRNIEGTGLGMAITKTFLHMMNSSLQVESEYGKGSTFSFSIRQEVEDWECMGDYEEAFKRLRNKTQIYTPCLYAPEAKVLVVDDMPMNIAVFKGLLKQTKVQIDEAGSGRKCLELCANKKYDVIFLDHMMPEMDGIETHKRLMYDEAGPNAKTPVIILTANAITGARDNYLSQGFDDYMSKPIDPEKLEKTLIRFLPEALVTMQDAINVEVEPVCDTDLEMLNQLRKIPELDVDAGIANTGGVDNYLAVVKDFPLTIDGRYDMVARFLQQDELHDFTIQVHGLKSSLRLVGYLGLSETARQLEEAGNHEDMAFINEATPGFLERFLQIKDELTPIVSDGDGEDESLPVIDELALSEMVMMMKSGAEEFDFDFVESVMTELEKYRVPESFASIRNELRIAMAEVDFDRIVSLLNRYSEEG